MAFGCSVEVGELCFVLRRFLTEKRRQYKIHGAPRALVGAYSSILLGDLELYPAPCSWKTIGLRLRDC